VVTLPGGAGGSSTWTELTPAPATGADLTAASLAPASAPATGLIADAQGHLYSFQDGASPAVSPVAQTGSGALVAPASIAGLAVTADPVSNATAGFAVGTASTQPSVRIFGVGSGGAAPATFQPSPAAGALSGVGSAGARTVAIE